MKKRTIFFSIVLLIITSTQFYSQKLNGSWKGTLEGVGLKIAFNFSDSSGVMSGTMDSPDQGAYDIPLDTVIKKKDSIYLSKTSMGLNYIGVIKEKVIKGVFRQGGMSINLEVKKSEKEKTALNRPQTPKKPFSYYTEDVTFFNSKDSILLKGTISLPKKEGHYPMLIMISGSGPQDRNSEVFGHKLFLVVSDYLTKQGIGVLRFGDRGVGESEGTQKNATSMDYSYDAESAVEYLKKQSYTSKIGLYGHSEGGLIAPMVASRNKDVDFIVLVAAPGVRGDKLLKKQIELTSLSEGMPKNILKNNQKAFSVLYKSILKNEPVDSKKNIKIIDKILSKSMNDEDSIKKAQLIDKTIQSHKPKWIQYFIKTDPKKFLSQITTPTLALNGDKDLQVYYEQNLKGIKKSVPKKYLKTVVLKNHNHIMQESTTGKVSEYGNIEQTTSIEFMNVVATWINEL